MPSRDISFCQNTECPQRKECYRFVGPKESMPWATFAIFAPDADGYCDGFMRVVKHKKARGE
jgi:hypothetical protein